MLALHLQEAIEGDIHAIIIFNAPTVAELSGPHHRPPPHWGEAYLICRRKT